MTPEREQNHISFEEIISNAKENLLRDGDHAPTLILEGSNNLVVGQIPEMPDTHRERMELMRLLGESAANSGRVNQLNQVYMISEGWLSMAIKEGQADVVPSLDPERKEVLIISSLQIRGSKKQLKLFEMLRDGNEQVYDLQGLLQEKDKKEETVEVPLLESFVQGFQVGFKAKFN